MRSLVSLCASLMCVSLMCMPSMGDELAGSAGVFIREIRLEGQPLFDKVAIKGVLQRYQDRVVSSDELLQLAQQLTQQLIDRGYVNSGVVLPDQKIENGIVHLQVIGGRIGTILVAGNRHVSERYIASRLDVDDAGAFNIREAVDSLQLLQRDPRFKKLNASIKPGVERGFAVLNVDVDQNRLYGASVGVDNHLSPNVGEFQETLDAYHLSVLGFGDALSLNLRHAEGFRGGSANYSFPLNGYDTALIGNVDYNESRIVTEPFAQLDIEGQSLGYGLTVRQPLIRSLQTELAFSLGLQREHVESFLLGEPFSFSASSSDGTSDVTMVQFAQEWVRRSQARVWAARSTFNIGIAALGASVGGEADGKFVEWLGQVEWLQRIAWLDSTFSFKAQGHVSNDALPAFRKYALGGANSVRGYRENLVTRDNGALASIEWSVPVAYWPVSLLSNDNTDGQLALIPFADYGYGWDTSVSDSQSGSQSSNAAIDLASVGLGIQWRFGENSSADLRYAKAIVKRESLTYDRVLQDDGVHFSVRIGF